MSIKKNEVKEEYQLKKDDVLVKKSYVGDIFVIKKVEGNQVYAFNTLTQDTVWYEIDELKKCNYVVFCLAEDRKDI